MLEVLHARIWEKAAKTKGNRGPTVAVVAYANSDHLTLKAGDTLICDASDGRISTAATSAKLLAMLSRRKVKLFHLPNLHAKVVRMPGHALIGSANMTANAERLHEAGLLTDDAGVLKQVDDFLGHLMARKDLQAIGSKFLDRISKITVVPNGGGAGVRSLPPTCAKPITWICGFKDMSEAAAARTVKGFIEQTGKDPGEAEWFVLSVKDKGAGRIQRNDHIVFVNRESKRTFRATRVTGVVETRTKLYHFVDDADDRTVGWSRVQAVLRSAGAYSRPGVPLCLPLDADVEAAVRNLYRTARPNKS